MLLRRGRRRLHATPGTAALDRFHGTVRHVPLAVGDDCRLLSVRHARSAGHVGTRPCAVKWGRESFLEDNIKLAKNVSSKNDSRPHLLRQLTESFGPVAREAPQLS